MYKPNTQLITTDLWAAAAADKLGFSVTTVFEDLDGSITRRGHFYTSSHPESTETLVHWRITVTESGPNAAERVRELHSNLIKAAAILGLPQFSEVI